MGRTTEELADLCQKILEAAAPEALPTEEIEALVAWIDQATTDRAILQLFERGEITLRWKDGDLLMKERTP